MPKGKGTYGGQVGRPSKKYQAGVEAIEEANKMGQELKSIPLESVEQNFPTTNAPDRSETYQFGGLVRPIDPSGTPRPTVPSITPQAPYPPPPPISSTPTPPPPPGGFAPQMPSHTTPTPPPPGGTAPQMPSYTTPAPPPPGGTAPVVPSIPTPMSPPPTVAPQVKPPRARVKKRPIKKSSVNPGSRSKRAGRGRKV